MGSWVSLECCRGVAGGLEGTARPAYRRWRLTHTTPDPDEYYEDRSYSHINKIKIIEAVSKDVCLNLNSFSKPNLPRHQSKVNIHD
jgi:hypothetical protein